MSSERFFGRNSRTRASIFYIVIILELKETIPYMNRGGVRKMIPNKRLDPVVLFVCTEKVSFFFFFRKEIHDFLLKVH